MKTKYCILVFFIVGSFLKINAQSQSQLIKVGDQLFSEKDYYAASLWYKQALDVDSTLVELKFKYAESLRMYNDYAKAEWQYFSVYKDDRGRVYPLAPFWYSMMLKYNGNYLEAKKSFKRIKRYFNNDRKGFYYQKIMQEIESCEKAIEIMKDTLLVDVKNIGTGINTYNSELGANFMNDSLIIYTSLRDEKMKEDNQITDTSLYLTRLFTSTKNNSDWNQGEKLPESINIPNYHIANGCLSPDEKTFYFNQCDRNLRCKIYAVAIEDGEWKLPVYEVKNVNMEGYTSSQPFVTKINNKEVLFFSSNRPGGFGMMDIWYAQKNGSEFSSPVNPGININSIEDEITPFYNHKDSSLYFSSNWHYGLGGFDIFKSKTDLISFQIPENLGFPINTSVNDFYYYERNNMVLLTSNRKGSLAKKGETCCNDIYFYEIPDTIKPVYTTLEELNRYLPVRLYFHNDYPDPRTRDTTTTQTYEQTYKDYTHLYNKYRREYSADLKNEEKTNAEVEIDELFTNYIDKGINDLRMFTPLLLKELEDGKSITLTIKGYASPLSKTDYNVNLTLRRIASLINYLNEYDDGVLAPYINGTAENGAALSFIKVPFGEYQANEISDDLEDKRNSVYSPAAALERKIEIIAISQEDTAQVAMDGSELEKLPLLTFKDSVITFDTSQTELAVKIINNGEAPLRIFEAKCNCEEFLMDFPSTEIPTFEITYLHLKRVKSITDISKKCYITFLTNTIPNKKVVEIVIE